MAQRGRRPVRGSAELVERTLRQHGLYDGVREQQAIILWPKLVGAALDRVTQTVHLREGVLLVRVQGAVWRSELHHMLPRLLEALNSKLNKPLREIRLVNGALDKKLSTPGKGLRPRPVPAAGLGVRELIERARQAASQRKHGETSHQD